MRRTWFVGALLVFLVGCTSSAPPTPTADAPLLSEQEAVALVKKWLAGQTYKDSNCLSYHEEKLGTWLGEYQGEGVWDVRHEARVVGGTVRWVWEVLVFTRIITPTEKDPPGLPC